MLGVGSIGSVVAASLASTNVELHLHVRGERGALSMLQGLTVDGQRSLDVQASRFLFSCEELPHEEGLLGSSDAVILACKSYAVPHLAQLATTFVKPDGVVLALANGLGHTETLTQVHGPNKVVAASTTHGAYTEKSGAVVWAGIGGIGLALPPMGPTPAQLEPLLDALRQAGLNPEVHDDASALVWKKVLLNLAINPIAALAGIKNGELLGGSLFDTCMMVYREAAQVATMERVSIPDEAEFEAQLRRVLTLTKDNTCSMLQDIKAGRTTEIGALNQALVQRAEAFGLSVPVNQMLASLVQVCHP